ncbi:MAG: Ldh family oxidoreductase [Chloroflexi bacterium]|nr:Ldh family oxidoreductase [Chloroflexota bacterium]
MPTQNYHFTHQAIRTWAFACLQSVGVPEDQAEIVSDALIQTSLWGIDSHGIARLPHYLARIQAGSIEADPEIKITETGPCTARLDGGHGFLLHFLVMEVCLFALIWQQVRYHGIES